MTQTPASANQVGDRVTYAFTGKLIAASACTVNNNKIIDVPFGNVGINKLTNGTDYTQNISWTLECGSLTDSNTLQMIIKATPESWDQKAMSSSVTGLGIRILKDGTPLELNTSIPVRPGTTPRLQAKLVKDLATDLKEQDFTATGTIAAEYF